MSFGTSYHDTREKNIAACERDLAASCPDRTLFRAFTSGMIIRKLQQRDGIHIDTPLQALQSWPSRDTRMWLSSPCTLSTATSTRRSFAKCRACARAFSV
nr:sirohydrochlorin cobaltochelatase [Klebsiella pneumoniae subsp. pneumoniae]